MKPPPFDYHRPDTLDETLELLDEHGMKAKLLAGGQSLIPTMNFRMADPGILIDINNLRDQNYIEKRDGVLSIGALTRQSQVENSELVQEHSPEIHQTMPYIAHRQIRNRGTIGGSLAHADPAAELPAVMISLGARFRLISNDEERWVSASDFFFGLFETQLKPEEILVEIEVPSLPDTAGWGFDEIQRRHGDFAIVGCSGVLNLDEDQTCTEARMVFLSGGAGPIEAEEATDLLEGESISEALIEEAAHTAAEKDMMAVEDVHASEEYRTHLAEVLSRRVLNQACKKSP